jgi:ABC-type transport system involved in multi-copper enzyme maturation permease subunit
MSPARSLSVVAWLVRDTFRQARASGIFWLMLAVSVVCVAVCLTAREVPAPEPEPEPPAPQPVRKGPTQADASLARRNPAIAVVGLGVVVAQPALSRVSHPKPPVVTGYLDVAFGSLRVPLYGDRGPAVRGVQLQLAAWIADAAGLLLALTWTAGFLPSFLEAGSVVVLLAKPVSRSTLLLGKFLGVLLFVAFQALVFVGGTWLALALRTGVWDPTYFLCVPLLLLHFAVFFSFSVMLAVTTRSTVACVFGSIVFWLFCWAMNFGRHAALLTPEFQGAAPGLFSTMEVFYWALPKPLDFHEVLVEMLQGKGTTAQLVNVQGLSARGAWLPGLSLLASALVAVALLAMAAYEFLTAEY